jgi:hypothetical protein
MSIARRAMMGEWGLHGSWHNETPRTFDSARKSDA